MDFNTFPPGLINIKKHLENGLFKNTHIDEQTLELKIRGNKNLIFSLNSFAWLFFLSSLNTHVSKKNTEYLFKKSNILESNFSYPAWKPDVTGLRLLALSLNINYLKLTNILNKKNELLEFLSFHVLYLNICKLFISRGLPSLRIKMGIFFSSFLVSELSLKRNKIIKDILKDLNFIFDNRNNIKSRNSSDLLELLFFINRIMKFSSTSDLSNGKIDKKLKKFQNIICPMLKGLSLGNGLLVRSQNSSGFSIYCELEKELSDANPSDYSILKNSNGFIRINPGRLILIFDENTNLKKNNSKDFMCSAFSFELSSGNSILMQNNTSFFCHIGKSDEVLLLKNQLNTLGVNIINEKLKNLDFISKVNEINHYRDLKNHYLEGDKFISFEKNLVFYNRKLIIPFSGNEITGKERIILNKINKKSHSFYLPFYFHPDVDVWKSDGSSNFLLKLKNNEMWRFEIDQKNVLFEEYEFLDPIDLEIKNGYRIVLTKNFNEKETVFNWKLHHQKFSQRSIKRN